VRPKKKVTSSPDIQTMVAAAFLDSGGLKAVTPLLIASTPVSAAQPLAKACMMMKPKAKVEREPCVGAGPGRCVGTGGIPCRQRWYPPTASISPIMLKKL